MPSTTNYKFSYFDVYGRGEVCRILFNLAGVKFEDKRYTFAEWPEHKDAAPLFQQLPTLEFEEDGKKHVLAQSKGIEIFLARRFGFMGKDDIEDAEIAQYTLGIDDLRPLFAPVLLEKDEEKKKQLLAELIPVHMVPFLNRYNSFIAKNGHGHLVGNKTTLADLALFHIVWVATNKYGLPIPKEATDLAKLFEEVGSDATLKAYIATRKDTPF
uniref:Glutathione transferase n=1 Tax=Rhabditophanes sp. KR3021 TaxID=114890 RepID=A0AC35TK87_9BILA